MCAHGEFERLGNAANRCHNRENSLSDVLAGRAFAVVAAPYPFPGLSVAFWRLCTRTDAQVVVLGLRFADRPEALPELAIEHAHAHCCHTNRLTLSAGYSFIRASNPPHISAVFKYPTS